MQGWVSIHRQISNHWLWNDKPFSYGNAWVDILLMANHKDAKVPLGKEVILVTRGSFITSEVMLMKKWGWSKSKVRRFLELLQNDSMIEKDTDKKKTTLTVCNYCVYQDSETIKEPLKDHRETDKRPLKDTNNNVNNDNNEFNVNNENKKPKELKTFLPDSIEVRASEYLLGKILANNPDAKKPNIQLWAKEFDLMIRVDKRSQSDIGKVIDFSQTDSFWKSNILSAKKLRDKYDQLKSKMISVGSQSNHKKGSVEELKEFVNGDVVREFMKNTGGVE